MVSRIFVLSAMAALTLMLLALSVVYALSPAPVARDLMPGPYLIYKTEPEFVPTRIKITDITEQRELLEPGYYFIAPHLGMVGYGPQIFDQDANLIWYGKLELQSTYGGNFGRCDYKGQIANHLCWAENRGANVVYDNHYRPAAATLGKAGGWGGPDVHEFNMLPGGHSYLTIINRKKPMDLRAYKGPKDGYVMDGCFQEISTKNHAVLFHWCFLDHYPIHETWLYLKVPGNKVNSSSGVSGTGTFWQAWDFMHMNAIDKNEEGDYIVSGRHLSQVIKIAGQKNNLGLKPGKTVWRLNGRHSDFKMEEPARFGRQHHCRYRYTGPNETILSVFNNAFDGASKATRDESQGMILRVNNSTMKAKVEKIYKHPKGHLSYAQGSADIQPQTKNMVVGWGTFPEFSEFSQNGTLLFHARAYADAKKLTNYRAFKYTWVGKPKTKPKMVAYCRTCEPFAPRKAWKARKNPSPIVAYVSWNGATEVTHWRFFLNAKKDDRGTWFEAGTVNRTGFETKAELFSATLSRIASFPPWVSVEALDINGTVLSTVTQKIFVPSLRIRQNCGREACDGIERFDYSLKQSRAGQCDVNWMGSSIVFVLFLLTVESIEVYLNGFTLRIVDAKSLRDIWL